MKNFAFNVFVIITLIPSFWVALSSNIVHAAFSLFFTFFGVAGLYVLLGADFLGVLQVLVYISGILVLIIFGVMMTQRAQMEHISTRLPGRFAGAVLSVLVFGGFMVAVYKTAWPKLTELPEPVPTTSEIGNLLLGKYLIPFEVASVLLLAVLVGAALIVRQSVRKE